jgi:hypothetical protein
MSHERHSRNSAGRTVWVRTVLALVAFFSVLAARNVLPCFPTLLNSHSALSADSHHDQRPRFDNTGSQWSTPAGLFLPAPPAAEAEPLTPQPQLFSALQTKGRHFNRPPPIG